MVKVSTIVYSDLDKDLRVDTKNFLVVNRNEKVINDMIKRVFTIFKGEILFDPNMGHSLEDLAFEFGQESILGLGGVLSNLLNNSIRFIDAVVTISVDPTNARLYNYRVEYTLKNDPNIGKIYIAEDGLS